MPTLPTPLKYMEVVSVDVDHLSVEAPAPVASVPQDNTPAALALTSQEAAFKFETMRDVDEARPVVILPQEVLVAETKSVVDEAIPEKVELVPEMAVVEA